jgi:hypothetical protein
MKSRGWASVGLALLLVVSGVEAAPPGATDGELTALFVRYYSALKKERWDEAFGLLHERLKQSLQVQNPHDLAVRNYGAQHDLIQAFKDFDHIEVVKAEVDLTSIKGTVTASGDGNVAGKLVYDLIVFRAGPGRPLMYRVIMDVGLEKDRIIRLTQASMVRIDPGSRGDVM